MGMARKAQTKSTRSISGGLIFCAKFVSLLISFTSYIVFSQECTENSRLVLPDDRFQIINLNIVRDKVSQLIWTRCPIGQTFIDSSCQRQEETLLDWKKLEDKLVQINENKKLNWRIPTVDELASLVETTCANPATNPTIFPLENNLSFWSDTAFSHNKDYQWIVDFSKGEHLTTLKNTSSHLLRLVSSEVRIFSTKDMQTKAADGHSEWQKGGIHDLNNPSLAQLQQFSEATTKLPQDQYSSVDWTKANKEGFIQPRGSIDGKGNAKEIPLIQAAILYKNTETADWVNFSHKEHAEWLNCKSCHSDETLDVGFVQPESKVHTGKQCGYCHGKVAFSLDNCEKCHNTAKTPSHFEN